MAKKTRHSWSVRTGGRPRASSSASLALAPGGAAPALAEGTASLSFPSPTQDPCASAEQTPSLREWAGLLWKPEAFWPGGKWSLGKVLLLGRGAGCPPCRRLPSSGSVPVPPPLPFAAASVLAEWPGNAPAHGQHPAAPSPASPAEPRPGDAGHPATTWGGKAVAGSARSSGHRRGALGTRMAVGPTWVSLCFCCPCLVLLSPPNPATSLLARVGPVPRDGPSALLLPLTCWQTCASALASCPHTLPVPAEGRSGSALSLCRS